MQVYHKRCFKCAECKKSLSAGSYAAMNGVAYCKPHFKQLFKTKVGLELPIIFLNRWLT